MNTRHQTKIKHPDKYRYFNPLSVVVSGVLISLAIFYTIYLWQTQILADEVESLFHDKTLKHVGAIRTSLMLHQKVATTLEAFFKHASQITRKEFHIFAGSLARTSPSMQALEWIPKVTAAERQKYEKEAGKMFPGFRFSEMNEDGGLVTASLRDDYYPVYYVEPYAGNEVALGFDLASETMRRDTMNLARDSGKIAMSGLVTLVQEKKKQNALLTFLPIYRQGSWPVNRVQRRQLLEGFVLAICHIGDMFERAITQLDMPGVDVWVYGASAGAQEQLLHAHTSEPSRHPPARSLRQEQTMVMGEYQWKIITAAAPTEAGVFQSGRYLVWQLLFIGVFITGVVAWHLRKLQQQAFKLLKSNRSLDTAIERLRSNETTLKISEANLKPALQKAELERSRLEDAIESLDAAMAIYDADERLIICNQKYRETYHEVARMIVPGILYKEILEKYFTAAKLDSLTKTPLNAWVDKWLKNFRQHKTGEIQRFHDHWLLISDYATSEGGVVSLRSDITSMKKAEIKIQALNRTHAVLSRSSSSLAQAADEKSLLSAFCGNVVEIGGYNLSIVFYAGQDSNAGIDLMAKTGNIDTKSALSPVTQQNGDYSDPCASEIAIDTEQTIMIDNLKKESHSRSWRNQSIHQAYQSMIALPLKVHEKVIGCFSIYSIEKEVFNKEEITLLEELANILSLGIETMRARANREQQRLQFKNEVERNERKRIAATLHDGVAQTMQAVNLNLKGVRTLISTEQQVPLDSMNRVIDNIGSVIDDLRTISHDLRPLFLERMGLDEAIRFHCDELSLHNKIRFHISSDNHNRELNEINKEQCFLSFREAINNAIKHAEATRIDITMETVTSDLLSIQIRDNGVGFNTEHKFSLPSGLGLSMISERIQSIGGHAKIDSSPGKGTIVTLTVPVKS